ncbi:MAG: hypothetical protein K2Q26_02730 [Bdellovibrionales bacterium]|nr:hypothetical protein [Bdellovibrionales bacterium]
MMSTTRGQLLPIKKVAEQESLKKLGTLESDNFLLDDLVRGMTGIWLQLRINNDLGYDPDDLIAKLILLSNLMRRHDPEKAFGSRSKEDRDQVLAPTLKLENGFQKLSDSLDSSQLPEEIHLQFLDAKTSFEKFSFSINHYAQTIERDEKLIENLYGSLITLLGSKSKATELVNHLASDLQSLGFKVRDKFEHKKWTRQVRENQRNRTSRSPLLNEKFSP